MAWMKFMGTHLCKLRKGGAKWTIHYKDMNYLWELSRAVHMLTLNTNRKSYMGNPAAWSQLTLSDLEKDKSRSLLFRGLYLMNRRIMRHEIRHWQEILYIKSSTSPSCLSLTDIERSKLRSLRFWMILKEPRYTVCYIKLWQKCVL